VCFAVPEESGPFAERIQDLEGVKLLVTGMGPANATRSFFGALNEDRPDCVFTCGFAGGLEPALERGTVLFETSDRFPYAGKLMTAGARRGRFVCTDRVISTVEMKEELRRSSGADAVEMESDHIMRECGRHDIPCATVRVILDTADESLPVDFNELMTDNQKLNYGKLAMRIAMKPRLIGELRSLQQHAKFAAEELGRVLFNTLGTEI
jgi:nucleoside phosphorylase